jgi:hypothetical protein
MERKTIKYRHSDILQFNIKYPLTFTLKQLLKTLLNVE